MYSIISYVNLYINIRKQLTLILIYFLLYDIALLHAHLKKKKFKFNHINIISIHTL